MATVLDAIRKIDQFQQEVVNNMPAITNEVATLFLAAKINQIKTSGIGQYSARTYPAIYLKGKELNEAGRSFLDDKIRKHQRTNWSGLRNAQGLQVQFVDVYYSGQMLNNTGIQRNNTASFRYYAIIGGRNDEAKKKLFANYIRYKSFLYPTTDQKSLIGNHARSLLGNIYKRTLLN